MEEIEGTGGLSRTDGKNEVIFTREMHNIKGGETHQMMEGAKWASWKEHGIGSPGNWEQRISLQLVPATCRCSDTAFNSHREAETRWCSLPLRAEETALERINDLQ